METLHIIYDVMICLNLLSPCTHSIVQTFICNVFALREIQLNREASTPKNDNLAVCIWLTPKILLIPVTVCCVDSG
jgi:hypothetical protein